MKCFLAGAICLIGTCAYAQTPVQPSAQVRALSNRVLSELNDNLQCSTANNELKDKLTAADAEVKRLSEKYEPKAKDAGPDDVNTDLGQKAVKPAAK